MKNRMSIQNLLLFSDRIDHGTNGIENPADKDKKHSRFSHGKDTILQANKNAPSHRKIGYHRKNAKTIHIDRGERDREGGRSPNHTKHKPCPKRRNGAKGGQNDRSIGACDQKIDGAVIDHAKHFFCFYGNEPVIQAGNREEQDDRNRVNRGRNKAPRILFQNRFEKAKKKCNDTEPPANNVGDHITNFLSPGVKRQQNLRFQNGFLFSFSFQYYVTTF